MFHAQRIIPGPFPRLKNSFGLKTLFEAGRIFPVKRGTSACYQPNLLVVSPIYQPSLSFPSYLSRGAQFSWLFPTMIPLLHRLQPRFALPGKLPGPRPPHVPHRPCSALRQHRLPLMSLPPHLPQPMRRLPRQRIKHRRTSPPTDLEGDVKYDFAGNPIPSSGTDGLNGSLPGQLGYSAGTAAGTWPPAPISPYGGGGQNSENGTDRVARLKWNWGAFLIPFWWSIFNGQRGIAVAIFYSMVLIVLFPRLMIGASRSRQSASAFI